MLPGAPTIYRSILDFPDRAAFDLHTLRVAVTGAADIPVQLIHEMRAKLPFRSILVGYGLTEAGTCTGSRPDDDAETIATTAGRAMTDLEVIIADAKGQEVERGADGRAARSRLQRDAGLSRRPRGNGRRDRRARLPAHRRPGDDGRARLRADRRPLEGHADRRRVQRVPGRGRERPAGPRRDRPGRGGRRARRAHGGSRHRVRRSRTGTLGRSRRDHRLGPRAPRQLQGAAARGRRSRSCRSTPRARS